jgi:hypothetical protein
MPHHQHDCDHCISLGSAIHDGKPVDFYWHIDKAHRSLDSVLVRFSSEGADYWSGHPPEAFAGPESFVQLLYEHDRPAVECFRRAIEKGIYTGPWAHLFNNPPKES